MTDAQREHVLCLEYKLRVSQARCIQEQLKRLRLKMETDRSMAALKDRISELETEASVLMKATELDV